jgi:tetratricopeptide (TPR) repeat protein
MDVHSTVGDFGQHDLDVAVVAMRLTELLQWAHTTKALSERRYRRGYVERAFLQADPFAITQAHRDAARDLGVDPTTLDGALGDEAPAHAVHVPLVLQPSGEGFIRMMHVGHDVSVHQGYEVDLDQRARRAASDALSLAAAHLQPSENVAACCFTTTHPEALLAPFATLQVTGPSLGAAAYVSAYSLWSRRAVRRGTVITGRINGSKIGDVGEIAEKLRAVVRGRADLARVLVPQGHAEAATRVLEGSSRAIEVVGVSDLKELVDAALEPTPAPSGDIRHRVMDLRRDFDRGWRGFRWLALRERVERTAAEVPEQRHDMQVEILSMLGAVYEHLGSPLESLGILERASRIAEARDEGAWVDERARAHLYQHLAITCRRLGRIREGRRAARRAVLAAERGRMRDELYKALGCAGLLELAAGRPRKAAEHQRRAMELVHAHAPNSCVRTHGYLIDALGQARDLRGAAREYGVAHDHLQRLAPGDRRDFLEAWLRTSYAAALVACDRPQAVAEVLQVPCVARELARAPLPGLLIRRYLGLALCESETPERGYMLLADSTSAYGAALEPGLRFAAQINVLCEAMARASNGDFNQDIAGRGRTELSRLPAYLRDAAFHRVRVGAERALRELQERPDDGRLQTRAATALRALIERASRLA